MINDCSLSAVQKFAVDFIEVNIDKPITPIKVLQKSVPVPLQKSSHSHVFSEVVFVSLDENYAKTHLQIVMKQLRQKR